MDYGLWLLSVPLVLLKMTNAEKFMRLTWRLAKPCWFETLKDTFGNLWMTSFKSFTRIGLSSQYHSIGLQSLSVVRTFVTYLRNSLNAQKHKIVWVQPLYSSKYAFLSLWQQVLANSQLRRNSFIDDLVRLPRHWEECVHVLLRHHAIWALWVRFKKTFDMAFDKRSYFSNIFSGHTKSIMTTLGARVLWTSVASA